MKTKEQIIEYLKEQPWREELEKILGGISIDSYVRGFDFHYYDAVMNGVYKKVCMTYEMAEFFKTAEAWEKRSRELGKWEKRCKEFTKWL